MVQFAPAVPLGHVRLHEIDMCAWFPIARRLARRTPASARSGRTDGFVTYSARKPYVVADRLDDLSGPTSGTVTLPAHLDWSGNATYDLGKRARVASMYRCVLNEAARVEDLRAWLNAHLLVQLWPSLWLPAALRRVWEDRFPQLSARRRVFAA